MVDRDAKPVTREVTDIEALRLLAHPLRNRIVQQLRSGPATSTTLAKALGESSGLTSYHLRQMAQHGFIEEVPELSKGRERWWRTAPVDLRIPRRVDQSPEMRAVIDEMTRLDLAFDLEHFARLQLEAGSEDGPWGEGLPISRGQIKVTYDELLEFFEEYIKLLYRYKRPESETPPGARAVLTRFFAFPAQPASGGIPGEPGPDRPNN
ncbi:helix-turn-helix domain-containing protein [Kitasatospora sp. NPDC097691]|uniref:ArsR/SmtB family transcription factor n=1 Tax=Kitasatospora sp. NPDC097691 TaxID=3157231 RepID=UPI003321AEC2